MAGHSQFKNIMHRKNAQDAKRAKVFGGLLREITVAVKEGGTDPESNFRLRTALSKARQANVPNVNIERILKGSDTDNVVYDSLRYEGFGPGGSALIVEVVTDNRNRSACDIRTIFNKNGVRLGETNSVSFSFNHHGLIVYDNLSIEQQEALAIAAIERGAVDIQTEDAACHIFCEKEGFYQMQSSLEETFGPPQEAQLVWWPQDWITLEEGHYATFDKFYQALSALDDVQNVWSNVLQP